MLDVRCEMHQSHQQCKFNSNVRLSIKSLFINLFNFQKMISVR